MSFRENIPLFKYRSTLDLTLIFASARLHSVNNVIRVLNFLPTRNRELGASVARKDLWLGC